MHRVFVGIPTIFLSTIMTFSKYSELNQNSLYRLDFGSKLVAFVVIRCDNKIYMHRVFVGIPTIFLSTVDIFKLQ